MYASALVDISIMEKNGLCMDRIIDSIIRPVIANALYLWGGFFMLIANFIDYTTIY